MGWKPEQVSTSTEVSFGWYIVFSEDSLPHDWPPFPPALIIWYLRANQHAFRIPELRSWIWVMCLILWVRKPRHREVEWPLLGHTEPQLALTPPTPNPVLFALYPNVAWVSNDYLCLQWVITHTSLFTLPRGDPLWSSLVKEAAILFDSPPASEVSHV